MELIFLTNSVKTMAERITKFDTTQASFNNKCPKILIVKPIGET